MNLDHKNLTNTNLGRILEITIKCNQQDYIKYIRNNNETSSVGKFHQPDRITHTWNNNETK